MQSTNHYPGLAVFNIVYQVIQPLIWPVLIYVVSLILKEMKRRGYQTTYATAIARALGAGVDAATQNGLDPFRGEGRRIAITNAVGYLRCNVNEAAMALGIITDAQHADRITAEMGSVQAKAIAEAHAMARNPLPAAPAADVTNHSRLDFGGKS